MSIEEQIAKLEQLQDYLRNELPVFAEQVAANDLAALVSNRVIQKGENYLGGQFKPYSTNTVAAWRFWGQSRTQAAEKRVRARSRARGVMSYVEFRGLNNLNTDRKNFQFTGEMWRKFGIVRVQLLGNNFKIRVGGTTPAAQTKIDENSAREGLSIIEANEREIALIQQSTLNWIAEQADRIING